MFALWIVSIVVALVFAALISGAALGRLLDRLYHGRLRARARRALARGRQREELLAEVDAELDVLRRERAEVLAAIERSRTGPLALKRQAVFEKICRAEAWREAIEGI